MKLGVFYKLEASTQWRTRGGGEWAKAPPFETMVNFVFFAPFSN